MDCLNTFLSFIKGLLVQILGKDINELKTLLNSMTKLNNLKNATEIRGLAFSMPSLLGKPVFFMGGNMILPPFLVKKIRACLIIKNRK